MDRAPCSRDKRNETARRVTRRSPTLRVGSGDLRRTPALVIRFAAPVIRVFPAWGCVPFAHSSLGWCGRMQLMDRRTFLAGLAVASTARAAADTPVPVRAITKGPRFHWFGYYDKLQFDPTSRFALGVSNDFQHRLVTAADGVKIGMVDLEDGDRWIELGETKSWSWHQTCMLQWLPGSKDELIWNDRQG